MSYQRKTRDEVRLWANYGHGWEHETTEDTWAAGRAQVRCYRENAPEYSYKLTGPHRVPIETGKN